MTGQINEAFKSIQKSYQINKYKSIINRNATIISNNCIAGSLYSRLETRFDSPTINLQFPRFSDYVKFCSNLEYYISCSEITELKKIPKDIEDYFLSFGVVPNFPFAQINDVVICFQHYHSFDEGVKKWKERSTRIHWNNIVLVGVLTTGFEQRDIDMFWQLPYKKILLSEKGVSDDRVFNLCVPAGRQWFSTTIVNPLIAYFDRYDFSELLR